MFALKRPHVGLFCFCPAFYCFVVAEKILATFIVLCCLLAELDCQSKLFFFSGAALPPCNRKGALSRVQVHKRHVCCRFQCRNGAKKQGGMWATRDPNRVRRLLRRSSRSAAVVGWFTRLWPHYLPFVTASHSLLYLPAAFLYHLSAAWRHCALCFLFFFGGGAGRCMSHCSVVVVVLC